MAKGNWNPNVIKPRARCRLCGGVILVKRGDVFVRLDGINPAHKSCADNRGRKYTVGMDIHPAYMASGLTQRALDVGYCACPPSVPRYDAGDGWKCHWCHRPRK